MTYASFIPQNSTVPVQYLIGQDSEQYRFYYMISPIEYAMIPSSSQVILILQ